VMGIPLSLSLSLSRFKLYTQISGFEAYSNTRITQFDPRFDTI